MPLMGSMSWRIYIRVAENLHSCSRKRRKRKTKKKCVLNHALTNEI